MPAVFIQIRSCALSIVVGCTLVASALHAQASGTPARSATPSAEAMVASWRTFVRPTDAVLKKNLTPLQYSVTQHDDTEMPYRNELWDNHDTGIYVDVVSGEPLFSSLDKYDSRTGWPSFTRPLLAASVKTKNDPSLGADRTEVRSARANSHLGHVFDDGPKPTGLRYCMNSAAMRFIPASKLAALGYGEYAKLFAAK